jgi:alanine dehydrogenase
MKDFTDETAAMRDAVFAAVMNTECTHPVTAIIALSNVLCSLAVHTEKPGTEAGTDETLINGIRTMLKDIREEMTETKVH